MAEQNMLKIAHGEEAHIDKALANGTIDDNDVVFTSDTHEIVYINDKKEKEYIRTRNRVFNSINDALYTLNISSDTYAGQIVMIKEADGAYDAYTVQTSQSGRWEVNKISSTSTEANMTWNSL